MPKITKKQLAIEFKSYLEMLESKGILPEDQTTEEIYWLIKEVIDGKEC